MDPLSRDMFTFYVNNYKEQRVYYSLNLCILLSGNNSNLQSGYTQEESIPEPRDEAACRSLLGRLERGECVLAPGDKPKTKDYVTILRKPGVAANPVLDVLSRLCRLI